MSKTVRASGGVVWRPIDDELRVVLVHRPKYDDWSLPKGKSLAGEHLVMTAMREVAEETGLCIRLGARLASASYQLKSGDLKTVDYWDMPYIGGEFRANDEVDALRWLPVATALELASNDDARKALEVFATSPPATSTLVLVRHARAGKKSQWAGDDRLRPLDHRGRTQAHRLARTLPAWRPQRIASADRLRCEQTVLPLAEALALPVRSEPAFTEEMYAAAPETTYRRFRELAGQPGNAILSSQGGVIPGLLQQIAADDGISVGGAESRKGSAWALGIRAGAVVRADYYPDFRSVESI